MGDDWETGRDFDPEWRLRGAEQGTKKALITRAFAEWRDPDSNRGHHDFQSCGRGPLTGRKSLHFAVLGEPVLRCRNCANCVHSSAVWETDRPPSPIDA